MDTTLFWIRPSLRNYGKVKMCMCLGRRGKGVRVHGKIILSRKYEKFDEYFVVSKSYKYFKQIHNFTIKISNI